MNGAELTQLVTALTEIAAILERLGVPGLIALTLAGPALVLSTILTINYHRGRELNRRIQGMMESMQAESGLVRAQNAKMMAQYREDMQQAVKELGDHQQRTDNYYRDNVELVKDYALIAKHLQDVVVSNTAAVTRLTVILEERRKII